MASQHHHHIKIHDQCNIAPPSPSSSTPVSLPLTFFDLFWLRKHPVERIFFYTLQIPTSLFFQKVVPNLKTSLSFTLHHFLPLAGNIVWPSDSDEPFVQYNPGDGVSFVIAESDLDFNTITDNSPREDSQSRSLVPHLESSNSHASVMSLQITLFPNKGFSIGITTHHAVFDGKSSTLFLKAWASLCRQSSRDDEDSAPTLVPELKPLFDREVIKQLELSLMNNLNGILSKILPNQNRDGRSLKIPHFEQKVEDSVRATFVLTREDIEKLKKKVLSKWDMVDDDSNGDQDSMIESSSSSSKPPPTTLSTFVLIHGYVSVCIAKAIQGVENERQRFGFAFMVDYRKRLDPPMPDSYFGNCIWGTRCTMRRILLSTTYTVAVNPEVPRLLPEILQLDFDHPNELHWLRALKKICRSLLAFHSHQDHGIPISVAQDMVQLLRAARLTKTHLATANPARYSERSGVFVGLKLTFITKKPKKSTIKRG